MSRRAPDGTNGPETRQNALVEFAADRLADWTLARRIGVRASGTGPPLTPVQRARLREDFAEVVPEAESMVSSYTGLTHHGYASRPWVMTRGEWVGANVRGFQVLVEPLAGRLAERRRTGTAAEIRRRALAGEIGAVLGYVSRRVLGQYDLFLPPDDDGLLYFVGSNVVGVERRFRLPSREFRLWLALHEVTHRLQYAVPWLRVYTSALVHDYLEHLELDPRQMGATLRRAAEEALAGRAEWSGVDWMLLLMSPEQRTVFRRMQSLMSLLEGHASFVMNRVAAGRLPHAGAFAQAVRTRRRRTGIERAFQRAVGFEAKLRQYDTGERFVASVVDRLGVDGFNRVWLDAEHLPTLEEIGTPDAWVQRSGAP